MYHIWGTINTYKILIGKLQGKKNLDTPGQRKEDNNQMY
jgi:hypothetical protein